VATDAAPEYNGRHPHQEIPVLACPFFVPTEKMDDGLWLHPSRLPLGAGWRGRCSVPGQESSELTDQDLAQGCNLGYASRCSRLPQERSCDAIRFSVARDRGAFIAVWYVREANHQPVEHGVLEYELAGSRWISAHSDLRLQKMAECYMESYLLRRIPPAPAGPNPSPHS
jgi:hypothetical protein